MINLYPAQFESVSLHRVGNKNKNERIFLSAEPLILNDETTGLLKEYFFKPFREKELKALRNHLTYGGFLLIDDNSSKPNSTFDQSVRRMIGRLFPHTPLERVSREHSIFRSFYLINQVVGRVIHKPYLEGITTKGRTVLVYSSNDLGGAWSKSKLGHWDFDMIGGGNRQRKLSLRLGVNIVMYALTLDYKKDMVHLPIILERLRRVNPR